MHQKHELLKKHGGPKGQAMDRKHLDSNYRILLSKF
jgi:hypothetical protein